MSDFSDHDMPDDDLDDDEDGNSFQSGDFYDNDDDDDNIDYVFREGIITFVGSNIDMQKDESQFLRPGSLNISDERKKVKWTRLYDKKYFDIWFDIGGETIGANRAVMGVSSEYFENLLYGSFDEARNSKIDQIKEVDAKIFKIIIRYCHLQEIDVEKLVEMDIFDLLRVAHRFQMNDLVKRIEEQLIDQELIVIDNVVLWYEIADLLQLPDLKSICERVFKNSEAILEHPKTLTAKVETLISFFESDTFCVKEEHLLNFIFKYKEENPEKNFNLLLNCVRLELLAKDYFREHYLLISEYFEPELIKRAESMRLESEMGNKSLRYRYYFKNCYQLKQDDYQSYSLKKESEVEVVELELSKHFKINNIIVKMNGSPTELTISEDGTRWLSIDPVREDPWEDWVEPVEERQYDSTFSFQAKIVKYIRLKRSLAQKKHSCFDKAITFPNQILFDISCPRS